MKNAMKVKTAGRTAKARRDAFLPKLSKGSASVIAALLAYSTIGMASEEVCTRLGGTMQDGICVVSSTSMGSGTSGSTVTTNIYLNSFAQIDDDTIVQGVNPWSAQFVIASGDVGEVLISEGVNVQFLGGEAEGAMGVYAIASDGGNGTIWVANGATLKIDGYLPASLEREQTFRNGLAYGSFGEGSQAYFLVESNGKVEIKGAGMQYLAAQGGTAAIEVLEGGEFSAVMDNPETDVIWELYRQPLISLTDENSKATITNNGIVDLKIFSLGNVEILNSGSKAKLTLGTGKTITRNGNDNVKIRNENGAEATIQFSGTLEAVNGSGSTLTLSPSSEGSDAAGARSYISSLQNDGLATVNTYLNNAMGWGTDGKKTEVVNAGTLNFECELIFGRSSLVDITNSGTINFKRAFLRTPYNQPSETSSKVSITNNGIINIGSDYFIWGGGSIAFVNNREVNFERGSVTDVVWLPGGGDKHSTTIVSYENRAGATTTLYANTLFKLEESGETGELPINISVKNAGGWDEKTVTLAGFESDSKAVAWAVKDDWAESSTWFSGGNLLIKDVMAGSKAAEQISTAFSETFGAGTNISFEGADDWASEGIVEPSGTSDFTAEIAQKLIDAGYAGAVVTNFDLENASADGTAQSLTVGGGTGSGAVISDSIGFRSLKGVSSVNVTDGKYLALVGSTAGGALVDNAVPVNLENGTLMLGLEGQSADAKGSIAEVTLEKGTLEANSGFYTVSKVSGSGDVRVKTGASLDIRNVAIEGNIRNEGTLTGDEVTVSKGTLSNGGRLETSGKLTIGATGTLVADGTISADQIDVQGVFIKKSDANIVIGAARSAAGAEESGSLQSRAAPYSVASAVFYAAAEDQVAKAEETTTVDSEASEEKKQSHQEKKRVAALPAHAQAFAAFDAVNRIAGDIESGAAPDRHGLWVKLEANDGRFGVVEGWSSFDVDTEGAVVGAEAAVADGVKLGAAVSYLDGEINASGLKNNWTSWGLHLYGAYRSDVFALKGTAGWLRGTTEAEKDLDADVWHAGLRAEYGVPAGAMTVTPFMGARILSGSFDDLDSQTVFSIPLGAKLSGTIEAGGWILTPVVEAAYVRSMGDTEADDIRFLPKDALKGSIGLKAAKGMWTGELSYVGATGSNGYRGNSFNVRVERCF